MPRRKKSKRRRSPKTTSLYDLAVAYGNASIITMGIAGTSPYGFITGKADIGYTSGTASGRPLFTGQAAEGMQLVGAGEISLGDIMAQPALSFAQMSANAQANAVPMALSAISLNAGAKIFRRVMRKPFNQANKLIRPLGLGVRL